MFRLDLCASECGIIYATKSDAEFSHFNRIENILNLGWWSEPAPAFSPGILIFGHNL